MSENSGVGLHKLHCIIKMFVSELWRQGARLMRVNLRYFNF